MKRVAKTKHFALETDLCKAFLSVLPKGWTPYAETAGWDILLVRDADGFQIGVQAKLKLNSDVLSQCLESAWAERNGPDCRAVLVPDNERGFEKICDYIGIVVISVSMEKRYGTRETGGLSDFVMKPRVLPELPKVESEHRNPYYECSDWYEWLPLQRHHLPEYVPDVQAGAAAPLQLTKWKIKAIKVCILLEQRGYLTRADFKHIGMDHRRWIAKDFGWLTIDHARKVYVAGPQLPDLKRQHPKNWEQIHADCGKWMPSGGLIQSYQEELMVTA